MTETIFGRDLPLSFNEGGLVVVYNGSLGTPCPSRDAVVVPDVDNRGSFLRVNATGDTQPAGLFASFLAMESGVRVALRMNGVDLEIDGREGVDTLVKELSGEETAAIISRFDTIEGVGHLSPERMLEIGARALALHREFTTRLHGA